MLGAIIGDMAGAPYESRRAKVDDAWSFPLFSTNSHFTDDSVMTLAVAQGIVDGYGNEDQSLRAIAKRMRELGRLYPHAGYGHKYRQWLADEQMGPYGSYGNGSAMRVSFAAWAYDTLEDVEKYAAITASPTHDHPEGIKGAQAVAGAIFLARNHFGKDIIRNYIVQTHDYDLDRTLDEIRPGYNFHSSCQQSVPEAIIAFLESENYEQAVRLAISLNGDSDTLAAIAGSIAEAYYGIPDELVREGLGRLPAYLLKILRDTEQWLDNRIARA